MGVSLSATAAVIGVSILIIMQIFTTSIPLKVSQINDAYSEMKNRAVEQRQTDISITNITDVGWWDTDWDYRKMIIVDHTKIQADQVDFPVLIRRTFDTDLADHAQIDGDDIVFMSDDNNIQFNHEIEEYNSATGALTAWVKIPTISANKDTVLYMYYGNPDCSSQQNMLSTWDSNFRMVQHLNESSGTLYDSTSNGNDGTNNGALYNASSKIDGGYDFNGSVNINCGNDGSLDITNSITLEAWVKDPPSIIDEKNTSNTRTVNERDEESKIFEVENHLSSNLILTDFSNRFSFFRNNADFLFNRIHDKKSSPNIIKEEQILEEKKISYDYDDIYTTEMNYDEAWNYLLEKANWSIKAYVGEDWQEVDGLNVEYTNTIDNLKKFSLAFTASVEPKADYRLTLAIDIPIDDYSFDSENATFTLRYTAFGHKFVFEYSYSDISALPGLVFDHGVSNGKFWFSIQKNDILYGTHVYLDPTYGITADQTTSTYEYDPDEGRYPDMIRLGTSEYYAIVSTGDTGAENDGYIRTVRVWNNNGTIQKSLVDWLEYDGSDGYAPSICLVSGDIYAISYYDDTANKQTIVTVSIDDANGQIAAAVTDTQALTYDSITTSRSKILNMGNNIFAVVYSDATTDLWLETWTIATDGTITNVVVDSVEISPNDGIYPYMCLVDSDTVAIVYDGGAAGGNDGYVLTRNISAAGDITNTNASSWEFDGARGATPTICKVSGTTYAIAYEDTNSDLYVKTCTIADTGMITAAWIDTQAIDTSNGDYPTFFNVSVNSVANKWIKGISFVGTGTDGWVSTFDVTSTGVIDGEIDTLTFGADTIAWYMPTCFVSGFYFLSIHVDASLDGWAKTYQIYANNPPQINNPNPANGATGVSTTPQLSVNVSDVGDILFVNWSSNSSGSWQGFGTNQSIYSYGAISDAVVNSWEYDAQEGLYPDVIRLGNSDYYAVVSTGDTGVQGFGYIRVIKAWNTNGTIRNSLVDSYRYDGSDGDYPRILSVQGDIYAIAYYDDTANLLKVVTTEIDDADGDCTGTIIDTIQMSFDTQVFPLDFIRVINNVFAVAYTEFATDDGWIETMTINNDGTIDNALLDSEEFNETYARHPRMCMVDADTIAIVSYDVSSDGYLKTYNISAAGLITDTYAFVWEFDGDIGTMADIKRVYGNVFAIAYESTGNDGWIKTVTIADTGAITKSWIDTYEFDNLDGGFQRILPLGNNLFGITYQGNGGDGWMKTIYISNTGDIACFEYDALEFDITDNLGYANIVSMGNDYYFIAWPGNGNDGWSCTVKIENETTQTLKKTNANFNAQGTKYYWRVNLTDGVSNIQQTYSFTTGTTPIVMTNASTGVEEQNSTLRGYLRNNGSTDTICGFWVDINSGTPYANNQSIGTIANASTFSLNTSGLEPGQLYYFRAWANNNIGFANGSEIAFLTKPNATLQGSFHAQTNNSNTIYLTWVNGTGANNTYIEYNITASSWPRGQGTLAYNGTGTQYEHTGLNPGTTYYYQAWSFTTWTYNPTLNQWSDANTSESNTTKYVPTVTNEDPLNQSTGVILNPALSIQVNHNNGYKMNITWYWGTDSSCPNLIDSNISVNNGTYRMNNDNNFSSYSQTYYWKVIVNDEYGGWTNETYYFATVSAKEIISKGRNTYSLEINLDGTVLYGYVNDNSVQTSIDTSWHYVTLIYDGSQLRIYKDGKFEANTSMTGNINTNANDLLLGRYLTGTLDEVRISSTARSAAWINTTYEMTISPTSFIQVESEQNQQNTYLNITIENTGSTTIKTQDCTLIINGTKTSFVCIQPCIYPLKETKIFANVTAVGSKRNKFITGNGIIDYEGYG